MPPCGCCAIVVHGRRRPDSRLGSSLNGDLMRPLADQSILITGATDGHGRALAAELAAAGATVLVHGRNDTRGQETIEKIHARTGNGKLHWLRADLASLDDVRALAEQVKRDN